MHRLWSPVIAPLLQIIHPRTIVEIGTGSGNTTRHLIRYALVNNAKIHSIDPAPTCDPREITYVSKGCLLFHHYPSLEILGSLHEYDCVLIDGDHNWYTVFHELSLIEEEAKHTGTFPLVFLHDTAWPYARRDLYYMLERIPTEYRHPYLQGGLQPGRSEVLPGNGLNNTLLHATTEGGEHNGVRTALEDFLHASSIPLHTYHLPCFNGLSILIGTDTLEKHPSLHLLQPFGDNPLLQNLIPLLEESRMEVIFLYQNLLREYINVKKLHGEAKQQTVTSTRESDSTMEGLEKTKDELDTYKKKIEYYKKEIGELSQKLEEALEIQTTSLRIIHSRSWQWTAPFRQGEKMLRYLYKNPAKLLSLPLSLASWYTTLLHTLEEREKEEREKEEREKEEREKEEREKIQISIVLACTNRTLVEETLASIAAQKNAVPTETLIIDTAERPQNTTTFPSLPNLRFLPLPGATPTHARNTSLFSLFAPFVLFLQEGDILHPDCLHLALTPLKKDPTAAITFIKRQYRGSPHKPHPSPNSLPDLSDLTPVFRCSILKELGRWIPDNENDHSTIQNIMNDGWVTCLTDAVLFSRTIPPARTELPLVPPQIHRPRATLCLPLSGRKWAWPITEAFLRDQTFPHQDLTLFILDTSQDEAFQNTVQHSLNNNDYRYQYVTRTVGPKGLADAPRIASTDLVCSACVQIHNTFAQASETPLTFFLEDDILPPQNVYEQLASHLLPLVVSVSALYRHRICGNPTHPPFAIWNWTTDGKPIDARSSYHATVGGHGFGCAVLPTTYLKNHTFSAGPHPLNYDHNFFHAYVFERGLQALIDWTCLCRHYKNTHVWV